MIKATDGTPYNVTLQRSHSDWGSPLTLKYVMPQADGTVKRTYLFAADWLQRMD